MKQFFISVFVATIVLQQSAFAQSNATVITPAAPTAAATTDSAAATSTAESPKVQPINVKYLGLYEGPALNTAEAGKNMHNADEFISNRPKVQYNFNANTSAGLETRIRTTFAQQGVQADNETWRLYGSFKNVASYGIMSLDLVPRVMLPTSKSNHNTTMLPSPEMIATLNINPKNSRFSLDYSNQMLGYMYSNNTVAKSAAFNGGAGANSFIMLHSFEGTFQTSAKTQLTFGWYPEYVVTKNLPMTQDSNEVDLGVNFDIAKGWSLNPYLGIEPVGMDSSNPTKSMEAALIVTGTFL